MENDSPHTQDTVYEKLINRILNGEYAPDQKLSEISLSKEFDCSRTPVREVMKRLENEGLLYIKPKSGTYVRSLSPDYLVQLQEVRTYLEKLSFRLALQRASDQALETMTLLVEDMDDLLSQTPFPKREFSEKHYSFHWNLVRASENTLLIQMYDSLNLKFSHLFFEAGEEDIERTKVSNREHQEILTHLKGKNRQAGEELIDLHLWVKKRILNSYYLNP